MSNCNSSILLIGLTKTVYAGITQKKSLLNNGCTLLRNLETKLTPIIKHLITSHHVRFRKTGRAVG